MSGQEPCPHGSGTRRTRAWCCSTAKGRSWRPTGAARRAARQRACRARRPDAARAARRPRRGPRPRATEDPTRRPHARHADRRHRASCARGEAVERIARVGRGVPVPAAASGARRAARRSSTPARASRRCSAGRRRSGGRSRPRLDGGDPPRRPRGDGRRDGAPRATASAVTIEYRLVGLDGRVRWVRSRTQRRASRTAPPTSTGSSPTSPPSTATPRRWRASEASSRRRARRSRCWTPTGACAG